MRVVLLIVAGLVCCRPAAAETPWASVLTYLEPQERAIVHCQYEAGRRYATDTCEPVATVIGAAISKCLPAEDTYTQAFHENFPTLGSPGHLIEDFRDVARQRLPSIVMDIRSATRRCRNG